jgi:3-oxoacyl-[acyl-carrier-protein] synthase I
MNATVFVAGIGVISGIGNNVPECLRALMQSETGIDQIRRCKPLIADIYRRPKSN